MMSSIWYKKGLVVGIIVLFVGTMIVPNISGNFVKNIENLNILDNEKTLSTTDWWPMFKHDLQNTGNSTSTAPQTNNIKWIYRIPKGAGVESSPAVVNGRVYFGSETLDPTDKFFCLSANTGKLIWKIDLPGGPGIGSPTVVDGKIYQGSTFDYVYCFDADTGEEIWKFYKGYGGCLSPSVSDNKVYLPITNTSDGYKPKLCCLNADNGTEIWTRAFPDYYEIHHLAIYNETVYAALSYGKLYCLDGETGDIIWEKNIGGYFGAPAIANGKVYAMANGIKCLDADTGDEYWHYQGEWSYCSPSVAYNKIYYVSSDGKVLCLNANTGGKAWSYDIGSSYEHAFPSPAIANGKMYVGIWSSGKLLCLDAYNGDFIWDYQIASPGWFFNTPAIVDGRLYIGSGLTNKIYCFEDPSDSPSEPSIDGPTNGTRWIDYNFTFNTTDPELDNVSYWIDWGDSTNSGWTDFYPSGQSIILSHKWSEVRFYNITAKAKDDTGAFGNWSDPFVVNIVSIPPDPPTIDGPVSGKPGKHYYYEFSAVDSEDDRIYYFVDWGDNTNSGWFGPFNSGHVVRMGHTWDEQGIYIIKVRAKDIYDAKSDWGELQVTMPRDKSTTNVLFWRLLERFPMLERLFNLLK